MKPRATYRSGFALLEAMFVLGLLAFVALVGGQIFVTINQTTLKTAQRQTAQMRFDQAIHRLRQDVWNASQCTLRDPQHLQIRAGENTIAWTVGTSIKREAGNTVNTWDELQSDLQFEVNGNVVVVVQAPVPGDAGGRVAMVDAAAMLKGAGQ